GTIIVADDLAPSRFLSADWSGGGLVLRRGSATSHVAILARARGVPMIVGVGGVPLEDHREALLDADAGLLILDPDAPARARFAGRRAADQAARAEAATWLDRPAVTAGGERGVRLSLRHHEVFRLQLRALARSAVHGHLKVMVPMVTLPAELAQCRSLLAAAVEELAGEGQTAAQPPLGMMVEVPAAALSL